MSGHQQQTKTNLNNMSEADAVISRMAEQARDAQSVMGRAEAESRNQALLQAAELIRQNSLQIETANQKDREHGRQTGLTDAFIDRLTLTADRI